MNKEELIEQLRDDRTHGASELAFIALQGIAVVVGQMDSTNLSLATQFKDLIEDISRVRPSMASLQNVVGEVFDRLAAENIHTPSLYKARLSRICADVAETARLAQDRIAEKMIDLIAPNEVIMTHSCSSIIKKILSQLIDKNVEVIVTESRPGNEGQDLARFLSDLHIETTYITEAQINIFMPEVTKVVLGADTILADGSVVNKAGTSLMAIAANYHGIPVYVCADQFKRSLQSSTEMEEMEAAELGVDLEHVSPRNFYFDITPAELVTVLVTDLTE